MGRKLVNKALLVFILIYLGIPDLVYSQGDDVFDFVFRQDFTNSPVGLYTEEQVLKDWNNPPFVNGDDKTYIVDLYGDRAMKFNFPQGNSTHSWLGGGEWWAPLPPGHEEIYFTYNVMFRPGFKWMLGGKLPGLGGVNNPTGGQDVTWDAGFSVRINFTEVKTYDAHYPDGKLIFYVYHQNKKGTYGDVYPFGEATFPVEDSVWYNLTTRISLNSVTSSGGNTDGIIEFFLDGKHIMTKTGMKWRNLSSIWIDTQHIVSFFGGEGEEFEPIRDEWILLDDFACYTFKEGVEVARGRNPTPSGTVIPIPQSKHGMIPRPDLSVLDKQAPSAPVNVESIFVGGSFVGFSWEASVDNIAVQKYKVYLDGVEYGELEETSYLILGLDARTVYRITVTALDEAGNESEPSKPLEISTVDPDLEPPSVPSNLRLTSSSYSSLNIQWDVSTDDVAVAEYKIYLNQEVLGSTVRNTYSAIGLSTNTEYDLNVTALDHANNESAQSGTITARTSDTDLEPPTVPSNPQLTSSSHNSLNIKWDVSTDDVGVAVYKIYLNQEVLGSTVGNTYSAIGLSASTDYNLNVTALDLANNESAQSVTITARTRAPDLDPPSTPDGLSTTLVTQSSIGLVWNTSTDNVEVAGYSIEVNGVFKGQSITNSYSITNLNPGLEYTIGVSSYDNSFNESPQGLISVTTQNPDMTSTPSMPSVSIKNVTNTLGYSATTTSIEAFGHTELQDFGLSIYRTRDFTGDKNVVYAKKEATEVKLGDRVSKGLQVLYNFNEQEGIVVHNIARKGVGDEANLIIRNPLHTDWIPGKGLKILGDAVITSENVPTSLLSAISESGELSLEVWIRPEKIQQSGPARLLSLSKDVNIRAATLGFEGNAAFFNYVARLSTELTGSNGLPEVSSTENFISLNLHHVVYTRNNSGQEKIFVNGIEKYTGQRDGELRYSGEDFFISLANEATGDRPWLGTYYMAAIYNHALNSDEVITNMNAGLGDINYSSNLIALEPNIEYFLVAFVRTDQGIVYGDVESLTLGDITVSDDEDSLYMAIYPNPSNGDFIISVQCALENSDPAFLRIVDINGTIMFNEPIELTECGEIRYPFVFSEESYLTESAGIMKFDYQLSSFLNEGIYTVMLIAGNESIARRVVIMK